jgi:polyisoprenoid-binding protein YceI
MKNYFNKILAITAICIIGFGAALCAQPIYKINDSKENNMKLSGTSTFHNWTMNAQTFTGSAQFEFKPGSNSRLNSVKSLTFSLTVLELKSGESGLDKNAYKALKTKQHKHIVYKLTSATVSPMKDDKYLVKTVGTLRIAGVTKNVTMEVYCIVNKDETVTCTGSDNLKMTDYQVKPPVFMVVMKTGDAIALNFTSVYKKVDDHLAQVSNPGK